MKVSVFILISLISLCGCGIFNKPMEPEYASSIKKVGVISFLSDIVSNEGKFPTKANWNTAPHSINVASRLLESLGFDAIHPDLNAKLLSQNNAPKNKKLKQIIPHLIFNNENDTDALIIIMPATDIFNRGTSIPNNSILPYKIKSTHVYHDLTPLYGQVLSC